jgi:hypothetical protein
MMTLLQGDTPDLGDSRLWVYLIVAALSVIGGLLGKKKKEDSDAAKRGQRKPATPRARPPASARLPQPARPARSVPPVEDGRPYAPPAPHPTARPVPPRPTPVPPRPVGIRRSVPAERVAVRRPSWEQVEVLTTEVVAEAPPGEQSVTSPTDVPVATDKPTQRHPTTEADRISRLLRSPTGLRAGFIMAEILAPPVALRENRPA